MKTYLLLIITFGFTLLPAQNKFYLHSSLGVQGISAEYSSYKYSSNPPVRLGNKINLEKKFQPTIHIMLGAGYDFSEYFSAELNITTLKFVHENNYQETSFTGISISPTIKGKYPINNFAKIFMATGLSYNSLKHVVKNPFWTDIRNINIKEVYSENFNTFSLLLKFGLEIDITESLNIFSETGISLIGEKKFTEPDESYDNLSIESKYQLTDVFISAGISYYIF